MMEADQMYLKYKELLEKLGDNIDSVSISEMYPFIEYFSSIAPLMLEKYGIAIKGLGEGHQISSMIDAGQYDISIAYKILNTYVQYFIQQKMLFYKYQLKMPAMHLEVLHSQMNSNIKTMKSQEVKSWVRNNVDQYDYLKYIENLTNIPTKELFKKMQKNIDVGEAIVFVSKYNPFDHSTWKIKSDIERYMAIIVYTKHARHDVRYIPIYQEDDNAMSTEFYKQYIAYRNKGDTLVSEAYYRYWYKIGEELKKQGIRNVYLHTNGVYNKIGIKSLKNPKTGKYVMDEFDNISYIRHPLEIEAVKKERKVDGGEAVVLGYPQYKLLDADSTKYYVLNKKQIKVIQNLLNKKKGAVKRDSSSFLRGGTPTDLTHSKSEVLFIDTLLKHTGKWKTHTYLGYHAQKKNILSHQPKVLHISTHFDKANWKYFKRSLSNLLLMPLSGMAQDSTFDKGWLSAYDIQNMNLSGTELVVFSICGDSSDYASSAYFFDKEGVTGKFSKCCCSCGCRKKYLLHAGGHMMMQQNTCLCIYTTFGK